MSGPGGPQQAPSIWSLSIVGDELRKLRDNAQSAAPSPDGSAVAFLTQDHKEIWLMAANGSDAHRILGPEEDANFLQVAWAPEGDRLAFLKDYWKQQKRAIETFSIKASAAAGAVWSDVRLKNFCWAPGGRIIGTVTEMAAGSGAPSHSDLWEADVDVSTGRSRGTPRRLTNLVGFKPISLSVTEDGRRLVLIRSYDQSDVYVGALQANGNRMETPERLTLDDRIDWPGGWTHDSKTILFSSDRQGTLDVFEQKASERTAAALQTGPEEKRQPQMSPDSAWIVYLAWPPSGGTGTPAGKAVRIPVSGGPPQPIFDLRGYPGTSQTPRDSGTYALTVSGYPDFRCPHASKGRCVLAEIDSNNKITFTGFDPGQGAKSDVASLEVQEPSFWDLSPDGSKIAVTELANNNRIRVLTAGGGGLTEIPVKELRTITGVAWAADGASFFLAGTAPAGGAVIRHVFPDGRGELLYKADAWLERPLPSPGGRSLAFGQVTSSNNVWAIENLKGK